MEYVIAILACFGAYVIQEGPKKCSCETHQNVLATDSVALIVKQTQRKCAANIRLEVKINPEDDTDIFTKSYTVRLVSSRGLIQEQVVTGSPRIKIYENHLILKRKDKLWVEVVSTGKYSVSLNSVF